MIDSSLNSDYDYDNPQTYQGKFIATEDWLIVAHTNSNKEHGYVCININGIIVSSILADTKGYCLECHAYYKKGNIIEIVTYGDGLNFAQFYNKN